MLDERFRALKETKPPDLWPAIEGREPRPPRREIPWGRLGTATLALVVAAAGFAFATRAFFGDRERREPVDRLAEPAENGLIAFSAGDSVSVVDPNGSGLRPLIQISPGQRLYPWEWSPNGSWLALRGYIDDPSLTGANYDIYVVEADGSGLRNLSTDASDVEAAASQGDPTWSPDGRMLAFTDDGGHQETHTNVIQVIGIDGTGRRTITDPSDPAFTPDPSPNGIQAYAPEWSPDGTRIAFARYLRDGSEVYTVAPDGGDLRRLIDDTSWNLEPAWSPDGARIAFVSGRTGSNEIFVMAADGSGQKQLTAIGGKNIGDPEWSPDGTTLIFEVLDEGDWDIWTVNADGTGQARLTDESGDEISPVWAPDGTRIAYAASPMAFREGENTGTFDVYAMDPDGTNVDRLTQGMTWGGGLAWQPVLAPSDSETEQPSSFSNPLLDPEVTTTVALGPSDQEIRPGAIAVGEGSVWVLAYFPDQTPHQRLLRIDPATNEVVAEILLPQRTAGEVAVGFGSVWVSLYQQGEGGSLGRIDPQTNELVAETPGVGHQVAVGEGSLWAIDMSEGIAEGTVARVDPATGEITARVPLPMEHPPVYDLAAGEGAVWAWTLDDANDIGKAQPTPNLFRIDPATLEVLAAEVDTAGLRQIVAGGGYIWVTGAPDEGSASDAFGVLRFDPETGDPVGEAIVEAASSVPLAYGEGGAWLLREDLRDRLCRLNEQTLEIDVCTPEVSIADLYDQAAALDSETGTIWISNSEDTVTRIDLRPT